MTISEMLELRMELSQFLSESIEINIKHRLNGFMKKLNESAKDVLETRSSIIKKIEPSGTILPTIEDGKENPQIEAFNKEYNKVLKDKSDVKDIPVVKLSEIKGLKTTNNYPLMYELIIK